MLVSHKNLLSATFLIILSIVLGPIAHAQSGNSTSITGTVLDPSGAVVVGAGVEVGNPVIGCSRSGGIDSARKFTIPNVPFNPYHVTVTGEGFAAYAQDFDVKSSVPINLSINLKVTGSSEVARVE